MSTRGMRADVFQCPIVPRRNSSVELRTLESEGLQFCGRFELVPSAKALQKVASIKVGELTVQTYPDADQNLALICDQLLLWFFICDDQFDERALGANPYKLQKICENFLRLLRSGSERAAISPLSRALLELRNRMWALGDEAWRERFIASMTLYLEGCLREAENRERGVTPDFDEYQQIRRASVGTYPCFDLIELSVTPRIPSALLESPALAMIRDLATDIIAWINDAVSYAKESAYDDPHNLITVLMRECGISKRAATIKLVEYYDQKIENLVEIESALLKEEPHPGLAVYVKGIDSWIRGVRDWSFESPRYQKSYIALSLSTSDLLFRDE